MSSSSDSNRYTNTTSTRIMNPRTLLIMRALWIMSALISLILFAVNVPIFYIYVIDNVHASPVLMRSGIPPEAIAIFRSILRRVGELCLYGTSAIIFWRIRDKMALLGAITFLFLAPTISGSLVETAQYAPDLAWLTHICLVLAAMLGAILIFTLPSGHFLPAWGKWILPPYIAWEILRAFFYDNPAVPISRLAWVTPFLIVYAIGLTGQIRRYRFGDAIYRHQFKWIIAATALIIGSIFVVQISYIVLPTEYHVLSAGLDDLGGVFLSIAFMVAITRRRLYDINLVIHRSLVYGAIALLLLMIIGAVLGIVRLILPATVAEFGVIVAALIAGAIYNPLRKWVLKIIDRRVYGFRFDLDEVKRAQGKVHIAERGLLSGSRIGGYEVLGVIGRGAMGEVYKAWREGQYYAIKTLPPDLAADAKLKSRFQHEIRTMLQLDHPNIVKTYDSGEENGIAYIVLEFVEGRELASVIKERGRLTLEDIKPLMIDFAAAIDYAHNLGFVHRDIKPGNVMLRPDSKGGQLQAVLMDFGLAKLQDAYTNLTGTGAVGTVYYMAPEQIQAAQKVDHRTDIYALGVMLYEMFTGERPFNGNPGQVIFAHLYQPPPNPIHLAADIAPEVAAVIRRAMAKNPADRFQSTGEMAAALLF